MENNGDDIISFELPFIERQWTKKEIFNYFKCDQDKSIIDEIAFRVLLCVNGCGTISCEDGSMEFYKGDCIFVPADSEVLTISGQAQFLDVRG